MNQKIPIVNLTVFIALFFISSVSYAQQESVSGTVTDAETGEDLPGVNIVVQGTTTGTSSNLDGEFNLNVPSLRDTLVFSFIGYESTEVPIQGRTELNITLDPVSITGEELVVVGFGTARQKDLTGSIATADIEEFRESPNVNIMQSLQGSVPGVQIGQVNQAGQEPSISIRGQTTLDGNEEPLIVVDGIIYRGRIGDLNPSDISSVNILKDASSKAIYGSQASNGVILISTYEGKRTGKPEITYSSTYSTQAPTVDLRPLNADRFLQKVKDIEYESAFLAPDYTEPNPDFDFTQTELLPPIVNGIENGTNFDWWDAQTSSALIMEHNLSVSGGSERTTYYLSGGYTDQDGFILNDKYERVTGRANIQTDVTDWLTVGVNTFGSFSDFSGNNPSLAGILRSTVPFVTPRDEDGEFIINPLGDNQVNPLLDAQADDRDLRNRISGNIFGIVEVPKVEGLTYRINYSNNYRWSSQSFGNEFSAGFSGEVFKIENQILDELLDNILSYEQDFGDHALDLTLVAGFNKITGNGTVARGTNVPDMTLSFNSLGQAINQTIGSNAFDEYSVYQVGRINYNFQNKYILTSSLRRDGYSGFAADNKFGWFPSVGAGWVLTEEPFFNVDEINYLKVRASYGESGNQTEPYSSLARISSDNINSYVFGDGGSTAPGLSPSSMANSSLGWESTSELNIGLDYSLFDDRISGEIDYYNTTTNDLLWDLSIPQMTGFNQVRTNLGELKNTGFEFSIRGKPVQNRNFTWDIGINLSTNRNEIVELVGFGVEGEAEDLVASGLFIGESIGTIFNYEVDGIWQIGDEIPDGFSPGSYRVVDQNGDGVINSDDRRILGRTEPAYLLGIKNNVSYKRFTLRFFINAIQGGKDGYLGANHPFGLPGTSGTAQNANWFSFYDYWAPRKPDARFANPWIQAQTMPVRYQSRSFIRLQDVSLSYQVDPSFLERVGAREFKVFVSGKNLLTITDWDGIDPETNQGIGLNNPFPVMRSYSFGFDISF